MSNLVIYLWVWLGRSEPVFDATGLSGLFDIELSFSSAGLPLPLMNEEAPTLFEALEAQLGLRLRATRAPVPTLIVEQVGPLQEN